MKPSSYIDNERNQLARYQILMQHRQHVERIFWSRIQILHLIQTAVIGGSFYLMKNTETINFAPALLFFGIVLTLILFIICIHDWMDAKRNDTRLDRLGDTLGVRRTAERWLIFCWGIKTHRLLYIAIILFILVDLALLSYLGFASRAVLASAHCWAIAGLAVVAAVAILIALAWTGKGWKIIHREP